MNPVVLDTSVLVAGFLSGRGPSGSLVEALFADRLKLAYSEAVLAEYVEVLARPEFSREITPADRMCFLLKLRSSGVQIIPRPVPAVGWPDPDDVPFVAVALATEEKIIVTLNRRDFAPATALGVRVLSPAKARVVLVRA